MNTDTFQDTVEKEVDSDSEKSLMFDYLTGNSTGMETKGTKISAIEKCPLETKRQSRRG